MEYCDEKILDLPVGFDFIDVPVMLLQERTGGKEQKRK
jgi:hypothetical protein